MLNKVMLIGRLGADPNVRYMPSGDAVTTISLATSLSWKDKLSGEKKEVTEWHRVVFFNRLAEISGEYLKKGSQVYIEGRLKTRKWQGHDGIDRYSTQIVAQEMQMLGSRSGGTTSLETMTEQISMHQDGENIASVVIAPEPPSYDDFDADIPF